MKDQNTTIHWHGLTTFTAPFSDAAPAATQWPIPAGHFFDYEVKPEGPLIVDSVNDPPYSYDEERTIMLSDFFNETDKTIIDGLISSNFTWSGETNALLVNESHDASIIEADGHSTKPVNSRFLQIGSGQRYSMLLTAKRTTLTNLAVLQYSGGTEANLTTVPSPPPLPVAKIAEGWLDYKLEPLSPDHDFPTSNEVTRRIIIEWVESFPKSRYLVDIYTGKLNTEETYQRAISKGHGFDNITRTFPAQVGEVLEIVWQNEGTFTNGGLDVHPFHAHGRHFYDIGGGDGKYNATANEERLKSSRPIQRDISMLYRYRNETDPLAPSGWRAWRIKVTDAGVWMYHCHSLQHMIMGMQTVFIFGDRNEVIAQSAPVDVGYLTYGGSAYGNSTHSPVVRHFFD
ncbi:hypothetical protein N7488_009146 [Penicillium malachiteum]|nr:hypothetical protein N7488_009146 [Penicillium malachiteum]